MPAKKKTAAPVKSKEIASHTHAQATRKNIPSAEMQQVIDELTDGGQNFAIIRSKGDQALFGRDTQSMKIKWKVPESRPLADFAPTIILKAKDFATEITIHNARAHRMATEDRISKEHVTNNQAVRKTLLERGITPENLAPAEDLQKVKRRLVSEEKKNLKSPTPSEIEHHVSRPRNLLFWTSKTDLTYYHPGEQGMEKRIKERLEFWRKSKPL
jgi:hypothetical protein